MTHQQKRNPGCILGATRRLARLIFSRWCRNGAQDDDVVPGFAVFSAEGRPGTTSRERHTREEREKGTKFGGDRGHAPSHCAPRGARWSTALSVDDNARRRRGALSRIRASLLSLELANTHYAESAEYGRCADAAAAVTCDATTSFPVAVVASTVVHRRPVARMSYRGRSAAPQRPSGTFTFEARAPAHGVLDARKTKKKRIESLHQQFGTRVHAFKRPRASAVPTDPVRPLRTEETTIIAHVSTVRAH
ncbi:hypothetical protein ALC57_18205 [Trachymyrmex cornetzi]|uniref:Uncharacterized protein n=1 Tax=Trachymyrmex cornetzi TaxID=471704 RepID=A0A195DB91_9HYME|nr:hypothetical protein ALC57_18205 [Trachymyrmex cornetzi]